MAKKRIDSAVAGIDSTGASEAPGERSQDGPAPAPPVLIASPATSSAPVPAEAPTPPPAPVPAEPPATLAATTNGAQAPGQGQAPDAAPGPAGAGNGAAPAPSPEGWNLVIKVVQGCVVDVAAPFSVVGHYDQTPPSGAVLRFDKALGFWISEALEMGIIGSDLGQLFFIPRPAKTAGNFPTQALILAGMGEAGRFNRDNLRYLLNNVAYAVLALGYDEFCCTMIGSGAGGLPKDRALRAIIEGVSDARERLGKAGPQVVTLVLAEHDPAQFRLVREACADIQKRNASSPFVFAVEVPESGRSAPDSPEDETFQPPASDYPIEPITRITVTRGATAIPRDLGPPAVPQAGANPGTGTPPKSPGQPPREQVLQYSALGERAVLPVRDVVVQTYFLNQLPIKVKEGYDRAEQEKYGKLFSRYLLPEDFRRVIDSGDSLTLIVDSTTASYPWEMAGLKGHRETILLGPDLKLTRQFRTRMMDSPGVAPPINERLKVLIIADPARGQFQLPSARLEGLQVLEVLSLAQEHYGTRVKLEVDVRIGHQGAETDDDFEPVLTSVHSARNVVTTFATCDPIEILALLLDAHYDVVHFAGHGVFQPADGREGWIFNEQCTLSADEIFKIHQVPRLVFANACHSARVNEGGPALLEGIDQGVGTAGPQVSLAEAFFSRGIQNYIGTGWNVGEEPACRLARTFYLQVLGLRGDANHLEVIDEAPPATLGSALAEGRRVLLDMLAEKEGADWGNAWGAYQHYGQVNAKLIDFPNRPGRDVAE